MKKLLALVLALVMTLGLATVSSNAAAVSDYKDADKISNEEAVAVMQATGIMVGDTNREFRPGEQLKRSEAAKIVAYLLLGNKSADAIQGTGNKFNDVGASNWYSGYVEYLTSTGVIAGKGAGNFAPDDQLTTNEFAKMLLVALGYDAEIEGLTGTDWAINTQKIANQIGLFEGKENPVGSAAVTRDEAALYAFNTLKGALVEYDSKVSVKVNDADVTIGSSNAKPVTNEKRTTQTIDDEVVNATSNNISGAYITEFAEKYYPKLERLYLTEYTDDFGRPVNTWKYDGTKIGSYIRSDLLIQEWTGGVSGQDFYNLLGRSLITDPLYDIYVFIDGQFNTTMRNDMTRDNKSSLGGTGDGVLTQVFDNKDDKEVTIAIINTYLAFATGDYDSRKDSAELEVYKIQNQGTTSNKQYVKTSGKTEKIKVASEDFSLVKDIKEDDPYLVTVAAGIIQSMQVPKIIDKATISQFSVNDNLITNGQRYDQASTAMFDTEVLDAYTGLSKSTNLKDTLYKIYLDAYGNYVGVEKVSGDDNYVFITGADTNTSNIASMTYKANAIFLDGTMATISVNASKSTNLVANNATDALINTWCTYTVDNSGTYTLKQVAGNINTANSIKVAQAHDTVSDKISVKHIALQPQAAGYSRVYGNDSSVYIAVELKAINNGNSYGIINEVDSVVTGVKNADFEPFTVDTKAYDSAYENADAKTTVAATMPTGAGRTAYGTYVLYKDNGYIIAAIVTGNTSYATSNLVYSGIYGVKAESYDSAADEWTWTRNVIRNGQVVELVETGDSLSYLSNYNEASKTGAIKPITWYKVSYNSKGQVATEPREAKISDAKKFVDDIKNLEDKIDDESLVIYSQVIYTEPTMKGSTFYTDKANITTDKAWGFWVAPNAKVVLIQRNQAKWTTETGDGVKAVESFVEQLHDNGNNGYRYQVNAVIENGQATSVILYDDIRDDGSVNNISTTTSSLVANGFQSYNQAKPTASDRTFYIEGKMMAITEGLDNEGRYNDTKIDYAAYNDLGLVCITRSAFKAASQYEVVLSDGVSTRVYSNVKFDNADDTIMFFDFDATSPAATPITVTIR